MAEEKKKKEVVKTADNVLAPVTPQDVEARMIVLRRQPVLIDADVAFLYGVETREVNQAVKNNLRKFPYGYFLSSTSTKKQR